VDRKGYSVRWYAIVPATLAGVAVAVPVLMARAPEIGFALQRGFALVCNQRPERSFLLFGGSVAVCARCLGIYLGAAVGLLLRVSRKVALRCLLAAVALTLADWLAELCGLHGNWMLARSALGFMLGATAAGLVMASINNVKIPTPAKAA
jgi:uncharacterized membrane protein